MTTPEKRCPAPIRRQVAALVLGVAAVGLAPAARAELTVKSGAEYAALCSGRGVPLPPAFGGGTNAWTYFSTVPVGESFNNGSPVDIYYWKQTTGNTGLCVAATRPVDNGTQSTTTDFFGVICQSTSGRVCFWDQASGTPFTWNRATGHLTVPNPAIVITSTNAAQIPTSGPRWVGGQDLTTGGPNVNTGACSRCHAGENAFINNSPATNLKSTVGASYWFPTAWPRPIVPAYDSISSQFTGHPWPENPGPGNFAGYPAGSCTGCHNSGGTGSTGGRFPQLSTELNGNGYCDILNKVGSNPANLGGMPPSGPNPSYPSDLFIKRMIDVGCKTQQTTSGGQIMQMDRVNNNSGWSQPTALTIPEGRTLALSSDPLRLSPLAGIHVSNGQTWNQIDAAIGMATQTGAWTKGSALSHIATYWNAFTGRNEVWEYDSPFGTSPTREATAGAAVSPAGVAFGLRRHNAKSMIVYRGTDAKLHGLYWQGSPASWVYEAFPTFSSQDNFFLSASEPNSFKRSLTANSFLYRPLGCPSCVGEYRLHGSTFYRGSMQLSSALKADTLPIGMRDNASVAMIFVNTTGGAFQLVDTAGSDSVFQYSARFISTAPQINSVSSLVPYVRADTLTAFAWREESGTRHRIHETFLSGSTWTDVDVSFAAGGNEAEATIGDPAPYINSEGKNAIVYRTVSQKVYQLTCTANCSTASPTWTRARLY
jgi:hypothetical protein